MWSLGGQFSVWESRKCICCVSCPSLTEPLFVRKIKRKNLSVSAWAKEKVELNQCRFRPGFPCELVILWRKEIRYVTNYSAKVHAELSKPTLRDCKNKQNRNANHSNTSTKTKLQENYLRFKIKTACQNRNINPVSQSHSEWVRLSQNQLKAGRWHFLFLTVEMPWWRRQEVSRFLFSRQPCSATLNSNALG